MIVKLGLSYFLVKVTCSDRDELLAECRFLNLGYGCLWLGDGLDWCFWLERGIAHVWVCPQVFCASLLFSYNNLLPVMSIHTGEILCLYCFVELGWLHKEAMKCGKLESGKHLKKCISGLTK